MTKDTMHSAHSCKLFIDGAARNNPGPAGIGICLMIPGNPAMKRGFFIGSKTNNQAEYIALIVGLLYVKKYCPAEANIAIYSDSQLLVRQISHEYRVKDEALKTLYNAAQHILCTMTFTIHHVMRENNAIADALANAGIDQKIMLPETLLSLLRHHAISL